MKRWPLTLRLSEQLGKSNVLLEVGCLNTTLHDARDAVKSFTIQNMEDCVLYALTLSVVEVGDMETRSGRPVLKRQYVEGNSVAARKNNVVKVQGER
jgi:hypothetical protein